MYYVIFDYVKFHNHKAVSMASSLVCKKCEIE